MLRVHHNVIFTPVMSDSLLDVALLLSVPVPLALRTPSVSHQLVRELQPCTPPPTRYEPAEVPQQTEYDFHLESDLDDEQIQVMLTSPVLAWYIGKRF